MSSDNIPQQRFAELLRAPAVLITGSEVECLLARHADARVAHPLGLLDFICERAATLGATPPAGTSWKEIRVTLSGKNPSLPACYDPMISALSAEPSLAKQIMGDIQTKLASLRVRDQAFARALTAFGKPIFSISHTNIGETILNSPSVSLGNLAPSRDELLTAWLDRIVIHMKLTGDSLYPLSTITDENVNIIFAGFDPSLPSTLRIIRSIYESNVRRKNFYIICQRTNVRNFDSLNIFPTDDRKIVSKPHEFDLRATLFRALFTNKSKIHPADLRIYIDKTLKTTADLDAFTLDYFPSVYRKFSASMDRVQRVNTLFAHENVGDIVNALEKDNRSMTINSLYADEQSPANKPSGTAIQCDHPKPTILSDYAKNLLLNRYSLVLADGHGPEVVLEKTYSGDSTPQKPRKIHKTNFLHWESQHEPDPSRDMLSSLAREAFHDGLKPATAPIQQMNHLVAEIKERRVLLHLLIRLLPPGVHISLSVLPILEKLILENQRHRVLHTIMPNLSIRDFRPKDYDNADSKDEGKNLVTKPRNQPGALIRTYYPERTARDTILEYDDVSELFQNITERLGNDYVIIRPYSGYALGAGLAVRDQLDSISESLEFTLTEDYHISIPKYGVFGIDPDRKLRSALNADQRPLVYADFEMQHPATRTMRQWVDPMQPPRGQDRVLRPGGLLPIQKDITDTMKKLLDLELSEHLDQAREQADSLYTAFNLARCAESFPWWDGE